jgi:4-cresol dehydrogenase (hydroxylating) flavoprotein subunit
MWIAPTLPANGAEAENLRNLMEPVFHKHGCDALFTFTLITERAMCCVTNVAFDRRYPEDAAKAEACYEELTDRVMKSGYILYRCGPGAMRKLTTGSTGFWDVSARIKAALDPQGILSRGRYEPLS